MTLDQAMAKAEREIDVHLEQWLDSQALRLIASGLDDPELVDILAELRAQIALWRLTTLEQIRDWLTEFA